MKANRYKVMVCDDSMLIRKKLGEMLARLEAVEVREAANGAEAVRLCHEEKPDMVFMDIVMPEKDGIEALIEIKRLDPAIRIIMASSVGTEGNLKKAIKAGADDFIQKPILFENVARMVNKYRAERVERHV